MQRSHFPVEHAAGEPGPIPSDNGMGTPFSNIKFPFTTFQMPAFFSKFRYTAPLPFLPVTIILYSAYPCGPRYLTEYPENAKRLLSRAPILLITVSLLLIKLTANLYPSLCDTTIYRPQKKQTNKIKVVAIILIVFFFPVMWTSWVFIG